jgi:hypothetical protein
MVRWPAATFAAALTMLTLGASGAAAATTPSLLAVPFRTTPGVVADTELDLTFQDQGAPPAKVVLYVAKGYSANMSQAVGTKIADVFGTVSAGGSTQSPTGQIVVDEPSKYATDAQAQACAPGTHTAVWLIQIGALSIPVFVDPTSAAQASLGSFQAQFCIPSPEVPVTAGGAPGGTRLLEADLDFTSTFTNPSTGLATWRAFVTPYTSGTAVQNPAGTVEVRSIVIIPFTITLKGRYDKRKHTAVLTGTVHFASQKPSGFTLAILSSPTAKFPNPKTFAVPKTKRGGVFTVRKRISRTLFFTPFVPPSSRSSCIEAQTGSTPCVDQTTAPGFGPIIRVKKR